MIKLLFLDIDGVLATGRNVSNGLWALEDDKQAFLGKILDETGASIVLSSSWRKDTVEATKAHMTAKGFWFSDQIVGTTIRAYRHLVKGTHLSMPRGVEIKQWIDVNVLSDQGKNFQGNKKTLGLDYNYVILDDASDMLLEQANNFVRTDFWTGLTKEDAQKCINILNYY